VVRDHRGAKLDLVGLAAELVRGSCGRVAVLAGRAVDAGIVASQILVGTRLCVCVYIYIFTYVYIYMSHHVYARYNTSRYI